MTKTKLSIPPYAKLKVYWDDTPINYSKEGKNKIRNHFANTYGINKNNINVIYRPVKTNAKGEVIEITGAGIDNIMDINYQRALMKELIDRDKKNIDFDRIIALDNKINAELNVDLHATQHRSWGLKWIMIDNFLSFGEKNFFSFSKSRGLTVVNSEPENMGGKTTLTIDAIKYLLHGTTTKTDKLEQIFNHYSGKDMLVVRGMLDIEGDEFIIERKMRRAAKKVGGWNVSNSVTYYRLLPDGSEKGMEEEDAIATTKKLKETIGSEKDFELLVLATEKNLDDLISLSTTDSGKLLSRLIGLEILEMKEEASRKMYNEFAKKKKSNQFDVITLANDIEDHKSKIVSDKELIELYKEKLESVKGDIIKSNLKNDEMINLKEKIDVEISELNPSKLSEEIETIKNKGIGLKTKMEGLAAEILAIGKISFDEDRHHKLLKDIGTNNSSEAVKSAEITRLRKVVSDLIAGGICQSCNRKLDTVDNTAHISKHELEIEKLRLEVNTLIELRTKMEVELDKLNNTKKSIDLINKLELDKDRAEVEVGSLRNQIASKMTDLKKYNTNLTAIELNRKIDAELEIVKTELVVLNHSKDELMLKTQKVTTEISLNEKEILTKTGLIETLNKEEEVEKIFKAYIELVGKKGISKLVLRSVLPIINSEVQRLLDDICDFEVEIFIDDKNDVQFLIVDGDTPKLLKSGSGFEKTASSLALRAVLGKVSTLPMPNFISFDEVFGKVAKTNVEKLAPLFEKIKDMYDIVFLITHNDIVKDWADTVLTVVKENNISRIKGK